MSWFYGKPMNDKELNLAFGSLTFICKRCDLTNTLYVVDSLDTLNTDAQRFAENYGEFIGYHATVILRELNGFSGYGCVSLKVVKSEDEIVK